MIYYPHSWVIDSSWVFPGPLPYYMVEKKCHRFAFDASALPRARLSRASAYFVDGLSIFIFFLLIIIIFDGFSDYYFRPQVTFMIYGTCSLSAVSLLCSIIQISSLKHIGSLRTFGHCFPINTLLVCFAISNRLSVTVLQK